MKEPTYEVRVAGVIPAPVLSELEGVEFAAEELRTVLSSRFEDQAALYGFLHRLRDLGLDVVEVRRISGAVDGEPWEQRR